MRGLLATPGGAYVCSDPAPGALVDIDPINLTGTAKWGMSTKKYRVVGVIPVNVKGGKVPLVA